MATLKVWGTRVVFLERRKNADELRGFDLVAVCSTSDDAKHTTELGLGWCSMLPLRPWPWLMSETIEAVGLELLHTRLAWCGFYCGLVSVVGSVQEES